ncbi:MAG: DMT family transporter [Bacillota bacterium]|nr:DMT family transporter [Bacillota bacterium]
MKKGYLYAVLSSVLFGSAGIFVNFAYKLGLNSINLLMLQYIISVAFMLIFIVIYNRKYLAVTKNEIIRLIIMGAILNTLMTLFYYNAFNYLSVSMVTLLLYTFPSIVFIYKVIFKGYKINIKNISALIIAFLGCILSLNIIGEGKVLNIKGIIFGMLASFFYALLNIYAEEKLKDIESLTINFYTYIFSLASLIIINRDIKIYSSLNLSAFAEVGLFSILGGILPMVFLFLAIKKIGAFKTSVISNIEIPSAIILSVIILREKISIIQILGGIMIILSILILNNNKRYL